MIETLIIAAAAFITIAEGDAVLEERETTISHAARAALANGERVSCRTRSRQIDMTVCLTGEEWRSVLTDAKAIEQRYWTRFQDQAGFAYFRASGSIR